MPIMVGSLYRAYEEAISVLVLVPNGDSAYLYRCTREIARELAVAGRACMILLSRQRCFRTQKKAK